MWIRKKIFDMPLEKINEEKIQYSTKTNQIFNPFEFFGRLEGFKSNLISLKLRIFFPEISENQAKSHRGKSFGRISLASQPGRVIHNIGIFQKPRNLFEIAKNQANIFGENHHSDFGASHKNLGVFQKKNGNSRKPRN